MVFVHVGSGTHKHTYRLTLKKCFVYRKKKRPFDIYSICIRLHQCCLTCDYNKIFLFFLTLAFVKRKKQINAHNFLFYNKIVFFFFFVPLSVEIAFVFRFRPSFMLLIVRFKNQIV